MVSQIPQNVGFYPGCYPAMIENHTNPEAEQFREKINDEIQIKQAYVRMEFLVSMTAYFLRWILLIV